MKLNRILSLVLVAAVMLTVTGCISKSDYNKLKVQNEAQSQRMSELESKYSAARIEVQQLQKQLEDLLKANEANKGACAGEIAALEKALAEKNELIAKLQEQLLKGGVTLPSELNLMLEELAAAYPDLITFDKERGIVKFKSDLTFEPGSDILNDGAKKAIQQFCEILNSEIGKNFDAIIAGHTDDMRISRQSTLVKHPTNWHLSANRGISVLQEMVKDSIAPTRLSARGFGEFRPIAPNAPDKKGNVINRRVEIYIVPQGL